jgi:small subunit ribosomal protein S18
MAEESTKQSAPERSESTSPAPSTTQGTTQGTSHQRPSGPRPGGPRPGRSREGGRKFYRRKKVCKFCTDKIDDINYKDVRLLSGFVAESGKIVPRRLSGVCTPHQRRVTEAIKQARNIALLPFASGH